MQAAALPGLALMQDRQEDGGQDGDNGDNDQQFNEREGVFCRLHARSQTIFHRNKHFKTDAWFMFMAPRLTDNTCWSYIWHNDFVLPVNEIAQIGDVHPVDRSQAGAFLQGVAGDGAGP